jgi:hypothetical protein
MGEMTVIGNKPNKYLEIFAIFFLIFLFLFIYKTEAAMKT